MPLLIAEAVRQVKSATKITPAQARAIFDLDLYNADTLVQEHLGANWFKTPAAAWLVAAVAEYFGHTYDQYVKEVVKPFGLDLKKFEAIRAKAEPEEKVLRGGKLKKQAGQRHVDALRAEQAGRTKAATA